jgi:hypothetical protein
MHRPAHLVEVTSSQHPVSILRVVLTVLVTTVLGSFIGVYVGIRAPKTYPASALILNPGHASYPPAITRLRAEITAYDLGLQHSWGTTLEQAANQVADAVELKTVPGGMKVSVILPDPGDGIRVVRKVSKDLGTPQHEAALAAKWKKISDITAEEENALGDLSQIDFLLHDQAREEGFESYAMVLKEAEKGNEKAVTLMRNEDFSRRLSGQQELTKKLGFNLPLGTSLFNPDNPVELGPIGEVEVPKYAKLAVPLGRFGGMAFGGLLVLALLRWKPDLLRPAPRGPAPTPAWAKPPSVAPEANDDPW